MKLRNSHSKFLKTLCAAFAVINIFSYAYAESLSYSGRLVNTNGSPVVGPVNLKFDLASTADTSTILCTQQISNVALTNGVFHVKLDLNCGAQTLSQVLATIPSPDTAAIRVTNESASKAYSFQSLHAVPSAQIAHGLAKLNANNNEVLTWTGSQWEPKAIVGATGGTVTSIVAGSGLSGGTITNSGTIAISNSGVTDSHLAGGITRSKMANGTANYVLVNDASGVMGEVAQLPLTSGGTGSNTAAGARTNLGLGTAAVANIGDGPGNVMSASAVPNCLASEKLQMSVGPVYSWTCVQDNDSLDGTKLPLGGGTMSGAIAMGNNQITGLAAPALGTDAATKDYVDTKVGAAPGDNLGNHTATTNLSLGTNRIFVGDGAWNTPSISFTSSTNTGIAQNGGNMTFTSSGSLAMTLSGSSLNLNGSFSPYMRLGGGVFDSSNPAYSFGGDPDTGMFNLSTNILGFTTGGVEKMRILSTGEVAIGKSTAAGKVDVAGDIALDGKLRVKSDSANYVEFRAPASLGATTTYTFPATAGTSGYALTTNGSGILSWSPVATTASTIGGDLSGTIANAQLVANSVGTSEIADASVTYSKLSLTDGDIPQAKVANLVNDLAGKQPLIAAGTMAQYWRGDKTWQTLNTSVVPEGTNLYFLDSRVRTALMSGYAVGSAVPLDATDTLIEALGKLEAQIIANDAAFDSSGIWSKNSSNVYYTSGYVGVGTSTPISPLNVEKTYTVNSTDEEYGMYVKTAFQENSTNWKAGIRANTYPAHASGSLTKIIGMQSLIQGGVSGGTTTDASAVWSRVDTVTGQTITNAYGFYVENGAGTGSPINQFGLYVQALTKGSADNFAIYTSGGTKSYFGGNVGIGTTAPQAALDVNGGIKLGSMTTCGAAQEGSQRYNSTLKIMEFCNGTVWGAIGAPAIPTGAIMAFDLTSCPSGWSEYTVARGRFLRGIDNGAGQDPSGTRAPGSYQADAVQDHTHHVTGEGGGYNNVVAFQDTNPDSTYGSGGNPGSRGDVYIGVGPMRTGNTAVETRPRNVAVLYCRKN
ncbi:hypothetical protein [Peredibacter starrii]|uniref:Tail fiber protein n=1 Tax=Peredibacter starrii TaxID=28202 RepID=A0AAX4HS31_9BACT|nr:hypothetical protein [Peredibacter starrii]WPU66037.1 hypothetical protein SOO65_04695 [Peredibacter starrii]